MTDALVPVFPRDQGAALQRLLDIKGPVRSQRVQCDAPFLEALEDVLAVMDRVEEEGGGWLNGSVSGQFWQDFMEDMRLDLLTRLQHYRDGIRGEGFNPASLAALKAERQKIERLYIRDMVSLYQQAAQVHKTLSG